MSTTSSNEYTTQHFPNQYIRISVLEEYVKARKSEFGENWKLTCNRGYYKLVARRELDPDEIRHLQRTSYPGYVDFDD